MKKLTAIQKSSGFTIVELMIALSVLSVLLIISTLTLMNLGRMYVKGSNQANAQDTARNVINDLAAQLQLGGAQPNIDNTTTFGGYFCIGTTRYSYAVGRQVSDSPDADQTRHALWRDTMDSSTCPISAPLNLNSSLPSPNGRELIPEHMRLTQFNIQPISDKMGLYKLEVGVAYGDDDLLCNRNAVHDCDSDWINTHPAQHKNNLRPSDPNLAAPQISCVNSEGHQFCAVSDLSITVARRLASE